MKYSEDEIKCIRIIAKWFRENRGFVKREEAIKEFDLDDNKYETLIRMMEHNGIVEKVNSNMRNGYASSFRPSPHAEQLAREFVDDDVKRNKENEFATIVELLKKEYLLKTDNELRQKTSEIAQDFVNRHLSNTTVSISNQLQVHYEHNIKLIDYIIESLNKKFADIPLVSFKEKLLTVIDEEYKRIISFGQSLFINAGLAQPNILKSFKHQINKKKESAKQSIEIRCAISEKQEARPKKQKGEHDDKELGSEGTKGKREGMIEPKPPEFLAKTLWVCKHWREHWKLIVVCIFVLLISGMFVLPKIDLFSKKPDITASTNIFADVSKDGTILRSNEFPWKIRKSKDRDGNILYTIVDRRGDATAVSVVPDYPKYTVYQSYDGMVIKYTCSENEISDFTIKLKY